MAEDKLNQNNEDIPMKYQISNYIKEQIHKGLLAPGDQIPIQKELCEMFDVSRMTVVNALEMLSSEGLIERHQGKGTFVKKQRITRNLTCKTSFTKDLNEMGLETYSKIIEAKRISPSKRVTRELNISSKEAVIKLKRLRRVEGEPVAITTSYLKEKIGSDLLDMDQDHDLSLFNYIKNKTGQDPQSGPMYVEPILLNSKEAKLLNVAIGSSGCITHTTTLLNNIPIEFVNSVLRGDKFRFVVQEYNYRKKDR